MNLIGKIFTVFNFLMAVVFASFAVCAWAAHKNWMEVCDTPPNLVSTGRPLGLSQQLEAKKKQYDELKTDRDRKVDQLEKELKQRDKVLIALENKRAELTEERQKNEKKIADLKGEVEAAVLAMKATHEQLANLRGRVQTLMEEIKLTQADRDTNFKKVVAQTDELHQAVIERAALQKRLEQTAKDLGEANEALRFFGINPKEDYKAKDPPPGLNGRIVAVPQPQLVEVSLGSDDGLRVGHKLEVVRMEGGGVKYVGRIEVVKLTPDRAACRVDPKMLNSPMQVNDLVVSRIK